MNLTGSLESAMLTRRNPRRPARSRRAAMLIAALALFGVVVPASAAQPNTSRTESSAPLSAQPKTESPAPLGAVVAIGGALRYDNHAVWSRLVALAGGRGARFVVLATASADPDRSAARSVAALEAHGAKAEHLRVAPKLAGIDLATAVQDPQLIARVHAARGVYFTGGAQERIVDTLQPGGRATPLLAAIRDVLDRGGVIAGTSAGAAVLSEVMFRDATDVLAVLKGSLRRGQEVDRGLGLAPSGLFVDQHFLRRGRLGRMLPLMQAQGLELGLGVEENSAAVLRGTELEVIGDGGVLFVDLTAARSDPAGGAFNLSGGRRTSSPRSRNRPRSCSTCSRTVRSCAA